MGLPDSERDAQQHPNTSQNFGGYAEAPPQRQANEETRNRREKVDELLFMITHEIVHKGGGVHSHERDERAEIEQFDSPPEGQEERSDQYDHADEDYVVARHVVFGINLSKERFREGITSSHAVEQAGRANLSSHTGAKVCDEQSKPDNFEQRRPGQCSGVNVGSILIGKWSRCRPYELCDINFRGGEQADHQAGPDGG